MSSMPQACLPAFSSACQHICIVPADPFTHTPLLVPALLFDHDHTPTNMAGVGSVDFCWGLVCQWHCFGPALDSGLGHNLAGWHLVPEPGWSLLTNLLWWPSQLQLEVCLLWLGVSRLLLAQVSTGERSRVLKTLHGTLHQTCCGLAVIPVPSPGCPLQQSLVPASAQFFHHTAGYISEVADTLSTKESAAQCLVQIHCGVKFATKI